MNTTTMNASRAALLASALPAYETVKAGRTALALAPVWLPALAVAVLAAPVIFTVVFWRKMAEAAPEAAPTAQQVADELAVVALAAHFEAAPGCTYEEVGAEWEAHYQAERLAVVMVTPEAAPVTPVKVRKPRAKKAAPVTPEAAPVKVRKPRAKKAAPTVAVTPEAAPVKPTRKPRAKKAAG